MALPSDSKRKIFDGRYEILSIVGRGADSVVYHARHTTGPAQEVAIKVLVKRAGGTTLTDKLRKEALTLVSCRHKYVVRLDDFHSIKDLCYLSMEYAPRGDLLKYIANSSNKLSAEQVTLFLRQSLEALDFIHATGVIHRDLKPENILVLNDQEIRLADFGLALLPGDEVALEDLRSAVGTFDYLAPEVLDGTRYDTQSDLYSLGVCFYELAAGKHPFRDVPLAQQQEIRKDGAIKALRDLAPTLAPHTAAVITTLMKFSADERFHSASDALKALANKDYEASRPQIAVSSAPARETSSGTGIVPSSQGIIPLPGDGSAAAAILTAQPVVAAVADVTPVAARDELQKPANSDVPTNRPAQPTEKIDLERVKAIIARDTQRKPSSTSLQSARPEVTPPHDPAAPQPIATSRTNPGTKATSATASRSRTTSRASILDSFYALPTAVKSLSVALLSAIATVGALLAWHSVSQTRAKNSVQIVSASDQQLPDDSSGGIETTAQELTNTNATSENIHSLPEGLYTGVMRGLLPFGDIPLAFISRPDVGGTVLVLGLEGWVPTVAHSADKEPNPQATTFRTNGLILQFNRELSSDKITGTVLDVITGQTGVWSTEKTS
jgi:serine/threonine protein kinase